MTTLLHAPTLLAPERPAARADALPASFVGSSGLLGLPVALAGGVGLALTDLGLFPVPTGLLFALICATIAGLFVASIWAAAQGDSLSAGLYGVLGGFYASYVLLAAADARGWFGASPPHTDSASAWLVIWLVALVLMMPLFMRRGSAAAATIVLLQLALVALLAADLTDTTALLRAGGVLLLGYAVTVLVQGGQLVARLVRSR